MLLKNKLEIEDWLNENYIINYELIPNKEYGYLVNVNDFVDLHNRQLKNIEVKFNIVNGCFDCSNNYLESLEGCPEVVKGFFEFSNNQIKSLKYSPNIVLDWFAGNYNKLISLEGISKKIKEIYLDSNNLNVKSLINLLSVDVKDNIISILDNEQLGELQNIKNFNELKKIITIYQEKEKLDNLINKNVNNRIRSIKITDKSVVESIDRTIEKLDLLTENNNKIIKI